MIDRPRVSLRVQSLINTLKLFFSSRPKPNSQTMFDSRRARNKRRSRRQTEEPDDGHQVDAGLKSVDGRMSLSTGRRQVANFGHRVVMMSRQHKNDPSPPTHAFLFSSVGGDRESIEPSNACRIPFFLHVSYKQYIFLVVK